MRNIEKNCLQGLKRQRKLKRDRVRKKCLQRSQVRYQKISLPKLKTKKKTKKIETKLKHKYKNKHDLCTLK